MKAEPVLLTDAGCIPDAATLREMRAVLELHERHAIVLPRSNAGTLARIPVSGPAVDEMRARALWEDLHPHLPRYAVVPWADAGCALLRGQTVAHFGLPQAGEDLRAYSLRINRYGYSTVLAHHAFAANPALGDAADMSGYLEMEADPADYFHELTPPHRPRLLYDLRHIAPHYYGTADFALNLLRELSDGVGASMDLYLDIQEPALDFFRPELHGYRLHQPGQLYDVAFKPTQINSWDELHHLNRVAPRIACTIQDMIAVRCAYLGYPGKALFFGQCAAFCDAVFTISESVASDFAALTGRHLPLRVVYHGTPYGAASAERLPGRHILLMGNAYTHKALREALQALNDVPYPIVVIGLGDADATVDGDIRYLPSGGLTREQLREIVIASRLLVYPSHYEGFGLPVVDALALGKPVIALDNETNRELARVTGDKNLHLIPSLDALAGMIEPLWQGPAGPGALPRRWRAAGEDYARELCGLLGRPVDINKVKERWTFLRTRKM